MQSTATTPQEYITQLPEDRKSPFTQLRKTVKENLPPGFEEEMNYGMIGYVVPHSLFPAGCHCNPNQPLPFVNIASQKNYIAFYHMGIYADEELLSWFTSEYKKISKTKPDMGKSCIRFKNPNQIPFELIAELCRKISVQDWIGRYEKNVKR